MREIPLGNKNIVGANIAGMRKQRHIKQKELVARMQAMGVDINPSSYSKLESQRRTVNDKELWAISKIFCVLVDDLFVSP
jgi:transcriptional regulator with XRE-family HTH domain